MQVVAGSAALDCRLVRPILTIGNFDGVHVGHQAILQKVRESARAIDGAVVVYTFDPHPRKVIDPERAPRLLMTLDQKLECFEEAGVDVTVVEPFTEAFRNTPAEEFLRRHIAGRIGPREVYVGYDFHYGRDREGSMRVLEEMGPKLGFAVTIVPEVMVGGLDVNSTRIRQLLAEGSVEEAAPLLGRPYAVWGRVGAGQRRGRRLGFPTLNLEVENEILPAPGVYAARVRFLDDGEPPRDAEFDAVSNVGRRPTFGSGDALIPEAHLLDFDADAYGRRVELRFELRLREERRFPDPEALRAQIQKDAAEARRLLSRVRGTP